MIRNAVWIFQYNAIRGIDKRREEQCDHLIAGEQLEKKDSLKLGFVEDLVTIKSIESKE